MHNLKVFINRIFYKFIRNAIEYFNKDKNDHIIPEWPFHERKLYILRLPFSVSNKKFTISLIKKLVVFANNKCKFNVVWNTRKSRSLFQSCIVYEGNCSCDENYVSESVINIVLRLAKHEDLNKQSEPSNHLK